MTDPILFDAAYPGPSDPNVNGCIFYGGGDTPHVWTTQEIHAAPGRFRLFCWVRSNPAQVNALADAQACLNAMAAIGYPAGCAVLLDLETAVDPPYVNTFGSLVRPTNPVWPYGSKSTLFRNPALDGYFPSDPTGVDHVAPGWIGCQFSYNGSYDEDDVTQPGLLWDLQTPTPTPSPPAPDLSEVPVTSLMVGNTLHVFDRNADGSMAHWWFDTSKQSGDPGYGWMHEAVPAS